MSYFYKLNVLLTVSIMCYQVLYMKLTAFRGLDLKRLFRGGFPGVPPVGVYALLLLFLMGDTMIDAIMYLSKNKQLLFLSEWIFWPLSG